MIMAVLATANAFAQGPGNGPGSRRGPGFGGPGCGGPGDGKPCLMADRLDLSEAQQEAIDAIHEKSRAQNLELRKQVMRLRNELKGEMLKDAPDQGKVVGLTENIGKLRTQMQVNQAKTRLAVRQQLTTEQRDKMMMMGSQHHGRRFGGQGREGCDGRGARCGSGPGGRPGPGFERDMGGSDNN